MGEDLRRLLEEGVRVAFGTPAELARFVRAHHVSPSLAQLLTALRVTFRSSVEALAWLNRRLPTFRATPLDLIAEGEAARVVRALPAYDLRVPA